MTERTNASGDGVKFGTVNLMPGVTRGNALSLMWGAFTTIGILVASSVGGRLFDSVGPSAPFVLVGIFNGLVLLAAIAVRILSPGPMKVR